MEALANIGVALGVIVAGAAAARIGWAVVRWAVRMSDRLAAIDVRTSRELEPHNGAPAEPGIKDQLGDMQAWMAAHSSDHEDVHAELGRVWGALAGHGIRPPR